MIINKPTFNKPIVYADYNIWGNKLNTILDLQDAFNGTVASAIGELSTSVVNLENEKVGIIDVPTYVTPVMDNYFEDTIKPNIDDHVTNVSLPSIDSYTDTKKSELDASILEANNLTITLTAENNSATSNIATLQTENSNAVTNYDNLVAENANAVFNKSDLEGVIVSSVTAKGNLDGSITLSETKKTDLDGSISLSETKKSELDTSIANSIVAKDNLQTKIDEVPSLLQSITDEGDFQLNRLVDGGFVEITDINTDFPLQAGYYEIIDNNSNQYSVLVKSDLLISENSTIHDVAGFIRLQGVEMPCKVAVRTFPSIEDNTVNVTLLELDSDFDNAGSVLGIKSLSVYENLNKVEISKIDKLDKGSYTGNAQELHEEATQIASYSQRGQVKIGTNLTIDADGTIGGVLQDLSYLQSKIDNLLETDSKNVVGAINENKKKIIALLGKESSGTIQNNTGTTVVGDIWYDTANEKYYECKVATTETFIDLDKWEERSIDAMNTKIANIKQTSTVLYQGNRNTSNTPSVNTTITLSNDVNNFDLVSIKFNYNDGGIWRNSIMNIPISLLTLNERYSTRALISENMMEFTFTANNKVSIQRIDGCLEKIVGIRG